MSFSAYLINTYEYSFYSYPVLRSYLAFDYSNLTSSLGYLRPFVGMFSNQFIEDHFETNHLFSHHLGYRGSSSLIQVLNDPFYVRNAGFLGMFSNLSYEDLFCQRKNHFFRSTSTKKLLCRRSISESM